MMRYLLFVVLICTVMISCEKESDSLIRQSKITISKSFDTTLVSTDTLKYSFGYFGDEESISIILKSKHAKFCELLNNNWEERILQYIPGIDFLGTDSVIVIERRGSDGASLSTNIDTTLIIINVVKNDFHKKLIGRWNWVSSCGGYTGRCWYSSENHYEQIEFDNNMKYIEKYNGSTVRVLKYKFIRNFVCGQDTIYEIGFDNGYDTYYFFAGEKLNIQGGDFIKEYRRIE